MSEQRFPKKTVVQYALQLSATRAVNASIYLTQEKQTQQRWDSVKSCNNFDFNGTQVEMAIHLGILPTGYEISAEENGIVRGSNTISSIECGSTEDFRMCILLLGVLCA
jgi:hypothetical protein